jgi:hypothetical protein
VAQYLLKDRTSPFREQHGPACSRRSGDASNLTEQILAARRDLKTFSDDYLKGTEVQDHSP